jgi:hypothetical protein
LDVAAIPEPAIWAMMILGFAGLGYTMRRRSTADESIGIASTTIGIKASRRA